MHHQLLNEQHEMNKFHLIGLTGYAGSGKDTTRALLEEHGFIGLAFANPIRSMLRTLLAGSGISDAWMDERELKEQVIPQLGVSYRHMAQTLGTEWGRSLQPDLWLRLADAFMAEITESSNKSHFVISDVRFANEAAWVRERGGVIWRINRPQAAPVRPHQSEIEIDSVEIDRTLHNTGSIDKLREQVAAALMEFA